jgi:hypothetical protein
MKTLTDPSAGSIVKSDRVGRTRYTAPYKYEVLDAFETSALSAPAFARQYGEAPSVAAEGQGTPFKRTIGTLQGGVISPLLANLFLHYAFDRWMRTKHPGIPFERYADDIVCHCDTMKDALKLKRELEERMGEVGLTLHPEKTQVVYVDTFQRWNVKTSFTFLGYDFKLRTVKSPRTGKLGRKCMPGAAKKAMKQITQTIRGEAPPLDGGKRQTTRKTIQREDPRLDRLLRAPLV